MSGTGTGSTGGAPAPDDAGSGIALQGQLFTTSHGMLQMWRKGTGPLIVLLHDIGSTHASYSGMVPHLVPRYHVCAIDLLGHGGSTRETEDLSVAAQAAAITEVFLELEFGGVCVVGHGLGGSVAIRLAASAPDRVQKLVLLSSGCYHRETPLASRLLRSRVLWTALGFLGPAVRRRCVARISGRTSPAALERERLVGFRTLTGWRTLGRAYRQNTNDEAISEMEELAERYLHRPTLAVWGTEDPINPISVARMAFRSERNIQLIEVKDGTHTPHEDTPDIVAELVLEFLK